jgi:hypothetical protein
LHISISNPPKTYFQTFDKFHKKKFSTYLYYCWIQKSIRFDAKNPRPKKPKYQITWVNCTYKFILTTYTNIKDKDLVWEDFLGFYEFMTSRGDYKKHKGIFSVGKDYICPSNWRLGPEGASSK